MQKNQTNKKQDMESRQERGDSLLASRTDRKIDLKGMPYRFFYLKNRASRTLQSIVPWLQGARSREGIVLKRLLIQFGY